MTLVQVVLRLRLPNHALEDYFAVTDLPSVWRFQAKALRYGAIGGDALGCHVPLEGVDVAPLSDLSHSFTWVLIGAT